MHKLALGSLMIVILGAVVAPATASEADRFALTRPNATAFWDANRGLLAAGDEAAGQTGAIWATTDGGATFHVVRRTTGAVAWVATAGKDDAWAWTTRCAGRGGCGGDLLRSSDGGASWTRVSTTPTWFGSFADTRTGFGTGTVPLGRSGISGNLLSRTSDGGATWRSLAAPCPKSESRLPTSVTVAPGAAAQVWALCIGLSAPDSPMNRQLRDVYVSGDSGRSWRHVSSPRARGNAVHMAFGPGGKTGLLWASSAGATVDTGSLNVTHDGGRHWEPVALRVDSAIAATVVDQTHWLFFKLRRTGSFDQAGVGRQIATLVSTADAGRHWKVVHRWG